MPRLTPQEIAEKMASRASAASGDYAAGVQRVTTAPGARAVQNKAKYLQRVQERADTWERRTGAVSLSDWQQKTIAKSGRYASGVSEAKDKIANHWQKFGPFLDQVTAKVRAMPSNTPEQREQRALEQMRGLRNYKG